MTTIGTLNDKDIIDFCEKGELITENFSKKNVKQACYELTASNTYFDISNSHQKYELKDNEYILIKPKQIVVILTAETLYLPNDMLGRILTKGKLFSIGLLPVNTYADPGFEGKLGIVFTNISNNYLKINPGDAIAKIEFSKLENAVIKSYSGQHGYETGIWPNPPGYILSPEEIKSDKRIKNVSTEIELSYGKKFAGVIKRIEKYERRFLLASISYLMITLILIGLFSGTDWLNTITTVGIGLGVNFIYGITVYISTKFKE
ncbi:dCTP deaminase domain-containing protein [Lysinibacillus xylanilyticus]|uniref:dCTP deaminase domain-containing protein n=1 Tax=Lysinibacillus xylanilyticus TaxID=582475 RepID=UPI003CFD8F4C